MRIYGNWPAPVYLSALVLIAALFSRRAGDDGHLTGVWKAALVTAAAITLPVIVQVVYPVLPLPLRLDRTARECAGWDQLGARVGAAATAMERFPNNVACNSPEIASNIEFTSLELQRL